MKRNFTALSFALFLIVISSMTAMGQNRRKVQKGPLVLAKVDLYWSAATLASGFPTFFPLELEVNLPKPHLSITTIFTGGSKKYNTQRTQNSELSFWGGLGLRYYLAFGNKPPAAQGFFVEPEYLFHVKRTYYNPITSPAVVTLKYNSGPFLGVGYQHVFGNFCIQARFSLGFGSDDDLERYQFWKLTYLPWLGIGFSFN